MARTAWGNRAYSTATAWFSPAILQIPVGCGKTGLMALLPFETAQDRVLEHEICQGDKCLVIKENMTKNNHGNLSSFFKTLGK
jgi:hypothetical protein